MPDVNDKKVELIRKDILDIMEALQRCSDTIWMDEESPIQETVFERLYQMFLSLGGSADEIKNKFPELG